MTETINYPIRKDATKRYNPYIYKCNVCGKEVSGYCHKVIYGTVRCGRCQSEHYRRLNKKYKQIDMNKIREGILEVLRNEERASKLVNEYFESIRIVKGV